MNQIRFALGAALVAAALSAGTAAAQGQITNITIGSSKDATTSQPVLPVDTKSVWVIFDYQRAGDSDITVRVYSPTGLEVFSEVDTYSGTDTARVEITGAGIYATTMSSLDELAEATGGALAKIASQQHIGTYAADTANYVGQMVGFANLISSTSYRALDQASLNSLTTSLDELKALATELGKAGDDEAKRAKAAEMDPHLTTATSAISALAGASVPDFPVPPSAAATSAAAYSVQIRIDTFPSKDAELWIWSGAPDATNLQATTTPGLGQVGGTPGSLSPRGTATTANPSVVGSTAPADAKAGGALGSNPQSAIVPSAGATATARSVAEAAATEKASQPVLNELPTSPVPAEAALRGDDSAVLQPSDPGYTVIGQDVPAPGSSGVLAGDGSSTPQSGTNVLLLLAGVVVLGGVAVFMKGRM